MEFLSINDILQVIRKSFLRILAISLAAGMIAYFVVGMNQTYTCTLGFRYNDAENAAQEEADTAQRILDRRKPPPRKPSL